MRKRTWRKTIAAFAMILSCAAPEFASAVGNSEARPGKFAGNIEPIGIAAMPQSAKSYYEGKTVTVIVGTPPGGGYDHYARLLTRHMGKHIPGKPRMVVENIDGAGGLIAANHLYNRVKPDGLTFMIFNHIIIRQLTGDPSVRLDVRKMNWIGTASDSPNICFVRHDARYQRFE